MTVAELDRWALEHDWGPARRARMEEHLRAYVVYPYERSLCLAWAEITHGARRSGRPINCADAWVAATAVVQGLPLVTHNPSDYLGVTGLEVVSASAQSRE